MSGLAKVISLIIICLSVLALAGIITSNKEPYKRPTAPCLGMVCKAPNSMVANLVKQICYCVAPGGD